MNKPAQLLASVVAVLGTMALPSASMGQLSDTFTNWLDHPAITYQWTAPSDPVDQLNRDIQAGSVQLTFDEPSGYLRSVLKALKVPIESQIAVFVKDSVQRARISLSNPRTLFFNDSVSVGWVRGGFIEVAAQDPKQGVIFYSLEQTPTGQPQFRRRNDCLSCHYSYSTAGVPGMLVRSADQFAVDHRTPFEKRWGGWYVTGEAGSTRHTGNIELDKRFETPPSAATRHWRSLEGKFDTAGYLSTSSDIVALMVFEHQMHAMNLLSRIGWEARVADYQKRAEKARPSTQDSQSDAPIPLSDAAAEVVDYLLFVDETPLAGAIHGLSGFAEKFAVEGPHDRRNRSLRQLDLQRRLMRYPCSYMVYAPVFNELPDSAKDAIYRRMWQVLSGAAQDARYASLSVTDRQAIVEILRDTKVDLPEYFRQVNQ